MLEVDSSSCRTHEGAKDEYGWQWVKDSGDHRLCLVRNQVIDELPNVLYCFMYVTNFYITTVKKQV